MTTRIAPTRRLLVAATALLASVATMGMAPLRADAAPARSGGFTTSITPATLTVVPGQTVAIRLDITSDTTTRALVDVEVYSTGGVKVFQQAWDAQSFVGGRPLTFTAQAPWPPARRSAPTP